MLQLVPRHIGSTDEYQNLKRFIAKLRADDLLQIARDIAHQAKSKAEQLFGGLVDLQLGVHGHPSLL